MADRGEAVYLPSVEITISVGDLDPQLAQCSVGLYESLFQTIFRSTQPVLHRNAYGLRREAKIFKPHLRERGIPFDGGSEPL